MQLQMALHFLGKLAVAGFLVEKPRHPEEPCAYASHD
jgi:hypothetical protein